VTRPAVALHTDDRTVKHRSLGPEAMITAGQADREVRAGLPRWLDVVLAGGALLLVLPVLVLAALAVKLSSTGPVLFRQERIGRKGRPFFLVKFRSWRQNGDRPAVTAGDHPLITPVGRFLRKTKLDELPSFWNVVRGDMSLVGPRPEVPRLVDMSDPLWRETLSARPGITDLVTLALRNEQDLMAQAQLRFGDTEQFYRLQLQRWKLDGYVRYLRQRTPWTDLRILLQTAFSILGWSPTGPPTMTDIVAVSGADRSTPVSQARWWPNVIPRPAQFVLDSVIVAASFLLAHLLRLDFVPTQQTWVEMRAQTPVVVAINLVALWFAGAHRVIWRYVTLVDQKRFALAVAGAAVPLLAMRLALPDNLPALRIPLSVIVMTEVLALLSLVGLRVSRRLVFEAWERDAMARDADTTSRKPVLFIGAGRAGLLAVQEVLARGDSGIDVKGFVDDDPAKTGSVVYGVPVLGTTKDLPRLVSELRIDHILMTIVGGDPEELRRIVDTCQRINVPLQTLPNLHAILQGHPEVNEPAASEMRA
jgi:lipopolysaccharide/colanic/teichoic acid biosynthesis glycosyltransferase/fumarate reductase subunit C